MYKLLLLLLALIILPGCTTLNTIKDVRDEDYTQGCIVVEATVGLGLYGNSGQAEACKLKCSGTLPDNYRLDYDNSRTGCHVSVGE